MDTQDLLSISQAAELLMVSVPTMWRYNSQGRLPRYRLGRKCWYRRQDIESFIESQRVEAAPTAQ